MQRLLLLAHTYANSQKIDSLIFSKLYKELSQKNPSLILSKKDIEDGFFKKNNCIYEKGSDYMYICVKNYWNKNWFTDFNNDNIDDIIIKTTESIIPNQKNTFNLLILNKNFNILNTYSLYSGGLHGSGNGSLRIDSLKNGHIHTTLLNNELHEDINERDYKPLNLEFFINTKKLQEKHYSKCKLYKVNKNIFKKTEYLTESFSFDEYYNEKKTETLTIKKGIYYKAHFSGCDEIELSFNFSNKKRKRETISKLKVKKEWLKHISFLSKNTKHKHIFSELESKIKENQIDSDSYMKYNRYHMIVTLKNKQKIYLDFSFSKHFENDITIRITSQKNDDLSYWNIMTKKLNK